MAATEPEPQALRLRVSQSLSRRRPGGSCSDCQDFRPGLGLSAAGLETASLPSLSRCQGPGRGLASSWSSGHHGSHELTVSIAGKVQGQPSHGLLTWPNQLASLAAWVLPPLQAEFKAFKISESLRLHHDLLAKANEHDLLHHEVCPIGSTEAATAGFTAADWAAAAPACGRRVSARWAAVAGPQVLPITLASCRPGASTWVDPGRTRSHRRKKNKLRVEPASSTACLVVACSKLNSQIYKNKKGQK